MAATSLFLVVSIPSSFQSEEELCAFKLPMVADGSAIQELGNLHSLILRIPNYGTNAGRSAITLLELFFGYNRVAGIFHSSHGDGQ